MTRKVLLLVATLALNLSQVFAQSAGPIQLDDGTPIKLRTTQTISSADAHVDDHVSFEVVDDVKVGDVIVIKHGTPAIGTVTEAKPKGRMGKGGKLNVNIDYTKSVTGDKVALRGVKDVQGGGHTGAMTGAMIGTAIVFWPAAPLFLFMHGKDITVPQGHEFNVYSSGALAMSPEKLAQSAAPNAGSLASMAGTAIAVSSSPAGADIEVDGAYVGSTPSSISVTPGNHVIAVKKQGYANWERSIRVSSGTVNVAAELSRAGHARSAGTN